MTAPLQLALDARRTGVILTVVMLLLVACHVLAMQANFNESLAVKDSLGFEYWQIAIFDLDEEESLGTWFSAVNLFLAALLFYYQAGLDRRRSDPMRHWWVGLAAGFALMSVDEIVGMHELVNTVFDESIWAGLSVGIVVTTGLCYLPFLWRYRWRTSALFVLAAILFVGGAVGVEQISGSDINSLEYNMLTGLEEGMEMSGVILAIYTVLDLMGCAESVD